MFFFNGGYGIDLGDLTECFENMMHPYDDVIIVGGCEGLRPSGLC
jgi:hypothetical protein